MLTGLREHLPNSRVNYIKPVGQKHVTVDGVKVDKDVVLFKKWFNLTAREPAMSPVVFAGGFTKDYVDGKKNRQELTVFIDNAVEEISEQSDLIVVEGTGHTGVGNSLFLSYCIIKSGRA